MEKTNCLNIQTLKIRKKKETIRMDIGAYFEVLKIILMASTFVVLILIFLYNFYGEEEKKT